MLNKNLSHLVGKLVLTTILLLSFITLMGCGDMQNSSTNDENTPLTLSSTAFEHGGRLDIKYTNANKNISVPLAWNKKPKGTKSYAIMMVDLHPVANNWVHWTIINIPANVRELKEGISKTDKMPKGSIELNNSFGSKGYGGPQPPARSGDHEYKTILYALNIETLEVPNNRISYADFQKLIESYIIESAEISGFYENE